MSKIRKNPDRESKKKQKKRSQNKKKTYTQEELVEAIRRVKCGEMTTYKVWKEFGIPRTTMQNHIDGKSKGFSVGRPPIFNLSEETAIKDFIIGMAESNNPVSKRKLSKIAKSFAVICKIRVNNKKWIPGEDWLKG